MSVTREYSLDGIEAKNAFSPMESESSQVSGQNILLQGQTQRTSTAYGRTATVKAGEDMRPALESLKSAGGGTLILLAGVHRVNYDIQGFSYLNIVGEGPDRTVIDFENSAYSVNFLGVVTTAELWTISIKELTIKNSTASAALKITNSNIVTIDNVYIYDCAIGFYLYSVRYLDVTRCISSSNSGDGFYLYGNSTKISYYFSFLNCRSLFNGGIGFAIDSVTTTSVGIQEGSFISCIADGNTGDGFDITNSSNGSVNLAFTNCISEDNTGIGFDVSSFALKVSFLNCSAIDNTGVGFEVWTGFSIIGGFSTDPITWKGSAGVVIGHDSTSDITIEDPGAGASINLRDKPKERLVTTYNKNSTAGTLTEGTVVVYGTDNQGYEITTTTTVGDDRVCGVVSSSMVAGGSGSVIISGFTASLKVNGTTDIAVGDFLCTYSVAGIAAKAAAGDMVFAIALEAYTTNDSNGVIDAIIISPRKL